MTVSDRPTCPRPECEEGHLWPNGYCDTCCRLAPDEADQQTDQPTDEATPSRTGSSTTRRRSGDGWRAGRLVTLLDLDLPDPTTLVLTDAGLAEDKRFCAGCGDPVGRGDQGEDGLCERCESPYSFSIKLAADDVVHDRYRVYGRIARGGFGWVYLARDLNLDQLVALKGLLNTADTRAKELVANERIALTSLVHPNVVRIHDFVRHPDPVTGEQNDYIVMEFIQGPTLQQLMDRSREKAKHDSLTPELVIAYVLEILAALEYLHSKGLLYCDMKPGNVIRGGNQIKVIDFGAVRAVDDTESESIGTSGFRVNKEEIAAHRLTERSDLHTVGKTLEQLCQVTDDAITDSAIKDPAKKRPISLGLRSLRHVYERALDGYDRRYASAGAMAEQLMGVLREIVALRGGIVQPSQSTVFVEPTELLDAGLGSVPPLTYWLDHDPAHGKPPHLDPPEPMAIALGLPAPLVRADDPGASFLVTLTATDPRQVLDSLARSAMHISVGIHLRACRAQIELGDTGAAHTRLVSAARLLPGADWRIDWYDGLIKLAAGEVAAAEEAFTEVYRDLPGEDAPKLALGLCAERTGQLQEAERFYNAVWLREKLAASAAFGLARIELAERRPLTAVQKMDEISDASRHAQEARIAAIRMLCGQPGLGLASGPDAPRNVVDRLRQLSTLDNGERDGPARVRLAALVRAAAVRHVEAGGQLTGIVGGDVLNTAKTPPELRTSLEQSLRSLADQAHTRYEHDVLVDRANKVRPRTWL